MHEHSPHPKYSKHTSIPDAAALGSGDLGGGAGIGGSCSSVVQLVKGAEWDVCMWCVCVCGVCVHVREGGAYNVAPEVHPPHEVAM